jgi:hypothetical protein
MIERGVDDASEMAKAILSATGRRPGVTVRGSVASPSASQTSAATSSL